MPLTTYHWGTYEIVTKDGALTALRPFAEDPDPSRIGPSLFDLLDHPARIKRPSVRRSWLDHGPGGNPGPVLILTFTRISATKTRSTS